MDETQAAVDNSHDKQHKLGPETSQSMAFNDIINKAYDQPASTVLDNNNIKISQSSSGQQQSLSLSSVEKLITCDNPIETFSDLNPDRQLPMTTTSISNHMIQAYQENLTQESMNDNTNNKISNAQDIDTTLINDYCQNSPNQFTMGPTSGEFDQHSIPDNQVYQSHHNDNIDDFNSNRLMMFDSYGHDNRNRSPNGTDQNQNERENDGDDDDDSYDPHKKVIVGICAMEKKAKSKPMREILRRLEDYFEYISTLVFEESVILNKPIEEWPLCDCLISFHSKGFPLSKAIEYARLRKPFLVNDLDIQYDIQDRRKVYKIIEEADIELPRYAVLDRDSANPEERELIESDDHIEIGNFIFNKPFVEKPISAEDHNICIYYPAHAGGGSQRLFRKIACRSSVYSNESHVRKTGSYIYEEFMPTDGTDVKVYTAGPDYAHAEARKSPALDGKVERDHEGKEIRYPVILTNREKLIARNVCLAFKQTVCGFDLLRANGRSYVCDVNGFSFVKSSMKYYEDCSKILGNMMLRALAPQLHIPWSIPFQLDDPPIVPTTFGRMMELRCVVAVIRHGDRTPKQKMKLEVKHSKFFELYQKYGNTKNGQAKLKKPKQLQEVLDIARYLLGEMPDEYQPAPTEVVEPRVKLKQLKSVLEMYGHFSGINRKVQLKYQPHGRPRRSSSEDEATREPSLVLILKWGGELTPAGRVQAEDLGRCFRRLYPASGDYSGPQGLGLLRLHSTFRHDLKIYASDEGRVQMTAGAFAKGFLALEGELTPILFQMVKSANTNGLLDNDCESSKIQKIVKERLHDIMQKNCDLTDEDMEILNPTNAPSIAAACKFISNPYQACDKVHKLIKELNTLIKTKRQDNSYSQEIHLYHGETWDLLQRRWAKLEKDFKFRKSKRYDISKIPDIYDCIKYDLQHNQHTLQFQYAHELHTYAKALADIVIPQEYGMSAEEKLTISLGTCSPLLRKIQADLLRNADSTEDDQTESVNRLDPKYSHGVSSPDRHVRTRLYFTSESHIHSLVTALQFGGLLDVKKDEQWQRSMEFLSAISELNYLSQIVIMLYEDPSKEPSSDDRFHVEIHFSSGVINRMSQQANMPTEPRGPGFRPHLANKSLSNASSTGSKSTNEELLAHPKLDGTSKSLSSSPCGATKVRLNLSGNKQQVSDVMIKEEQTDDERSNEDADSKGNSKNSSVSITPKTSPIDGVSPSFQGKSTSNPTKRQSYQKSNQRCLSRSYSANTPISLQDLFKKSEIVNRADALEVTNENVTSSDYQKHPLLLQQQLLQEDIDGELPDEEPQLIGSSGEIRDVKNKTIGEGASQVINGQALAGNNNNSEAICVAINELEERKKTTTTSNTTTTTSTTVGVGSASSLTTSSSASTTTNTIIEQHSQAIFNNAAIAAAAALGVDDNRKEDNNGNGEVLSRESKQSSSSVQIPLTSTSTPRVSSETIDITMTTASTPTPIATQRIPEKNNWKTYEQYLASELTSSPQLGHHHHHRHHGVATSGYYSTASSSSSSRQLRRVYNQLDQQLINLPNTYHTIHNWNFSPSNLPQQNQLNQQQQQQFLDQSFSTTPSMTIGSSLHYRPSSISMSTSPQQLTVSQSGGLSGVGGSSNIHQRYLAHMQQQAGGHRQFFTMSASMPIQYKSNQNPRACSVADVSQYCGPSSLISTAVISGSSPELVAVCPYSPNIRPLETLHNELSLKPFIDFIDRLTRNHRSSNMSSENNNSSNYLLTVSELTVPNDNVSIRTRSSSQDITNDANSLIGGRQSQQIANQLNQRKPHSLSINTNNNNNGGNNNGQTIPGLSPGNSLSNSLIWSNPPSSFASSVGPSSPSGVLELWSKLELEENSNQNVNLANSDLSNNSTNNSNANIATPIILLSAGSPNQLITGSAAAAAAISPSSSTTNIISPKQQ